MPGEEAGRLVTRSGRVHSLFHATSHYPSGKALTPHNVCNALAPTPREALTPHNVCNALAPTPLSQFWERGDSVVVRMSGLPSLL
jgi:hypothetical protein